MELRRRRWYVAWFFLSLAVLDKFLGRPSREWRPSAGEWQPSEYRYKRGTNLCHFMRVTLVWTPIVVGLHLAVYAAALAVLTIVPIRLFGWSGYLAAIVAVVCIILAILLMAVLRWLVVDVLGDYLTNKRYEARMLRSREEDRAALPEPREDKGPTFAQLVLEDIRAAKQQVCPTISFKE